MSLARTDTVLILDGEDLLKAEELESRLNAREAEIKSRDERMEKAAARVKALLEQLPAEA